jgi:hypothetical protein
MSLMLHEVYERDDSERLSPEDLATVREAEFTHAALAVIQAAAKRLQLSRGTCANCSEACAPHLTYCDDDCRADHERRLASARRSGRGPAA